MPETSKLLEYSGCVDYPTIDLLLNKFKKGKDFITLDKTTRKRIYAIVAECLENIARHSVKEPYLSRKTQPLISVTRQKDKIIIKAANPVLNNKIEKLDENLQLINRLDEKSFLELYYKKINRQVENDSGLGFIMMKSKAGKIDYNFTKINSNQSLFQMQISINEHIMRNLFIEGTQGSPKVILNADKNIYEISGESRPADVPGFYKPVLSWLDEYKTYLDKSGEGKNMGFFNLDFEFFNSSSAKFILDFCKKLAFIRSEGNNIVIKWHYEEDDFDMLEAGREMSRIAKIPFEFLPKKS